eukprot:2491522-Heterocapsa_arctica.AAC.1
MRVPLLKATQFHTCVYIVALEIATSSSAVLRSVSLPNPFMHKMSNVANKKKVRVVVIGEVFKAGHTTTTLSLIHI